MKETLSGFKEFILRGNVVELAVAVIIGTAFSDIVAKIQEGVINPLIAAFFSAPDLSSAGAFTINDAVFRPGLVLNAVINFLIVAAVIYFVIIVPLNKLSKARKKGEVEEPAAPSEEILLLQQIRDLLSEQNGGTSTPGAPSPGVTPTI